MLLALEEFFKITYVLWYITQVFSSDFSSYLSLNWVSNNSINTEHDTPNPGTTLQSGVLTYFCAGVLWYIRIFFTECSIKKKIIKFTISSSKNPQEEKIYRTTILKNINRPFYMYLAKNMAQFLRFFVLNNSTKHAKSWKILIYKRKGHTMNTKHLPSALRKSSSSRCKEFTIKFWKSYLQLCYYSLG